MLPGLALLPPGGVVGAMALQDRIRGWRSRRATLRGEPESNGHEDVQSSETAPIHVAGTQVTEVDPRGG